MGNRKTHEEFEREIYMLNPNIKLLSKYTKAKEKIKCKCLICGGEWNVRASHLKEGSGCPVCAKRKRMKSNDDFLKELNEVNPNIIPLDKYNGSNTIIRFKCKIDGYEWETTPASILYATGCPKCFIEKLKNQKRKSHEQFINDVCNTNENIEILTHYTNNYTKVLCRCKIDGHEWYAIPRNLLNGSGCPLCGEKSRINKRIKTNSDFIKEASIKNPKIEIIEDYINSNTKILCRCEFGHTWKTLPSNILSGHGCPICTGVFKYTHEDFMKKFNNLYDSDEYEVLSEYINSQEKILFKHKKCNNKFEMIANNFLCGQRCPYCSKSKGENKIEKILNSLKINYTPQKTYDGLVGVNNGLLSYDFYLPKYNLLIEYQGVQHEKPIDFSGKNKQLAIENFKKQKEHDKRKNNYAKQNNIDLLEIWYYDFDNIESILERCLIA